MSAGMWGGDFGDAVGAGLVVGAGEDCFGAETLGGFQDAVVFGGYDDLDFLLGLADAFNHVLNHRLTGDFGEGFAREADGGVAGGNDDQGLWRRSVWDIL